MQARHSLLIAAAAFATTGAIHSALAASIAVTNFSFELPTLPGDNRYAGDGAAGDPGAGNLPGWVSDGPNGVQNFSGGFPGDVESSPSGGNMDAPADGKQALYVNGNYVYQDVGALLANTTYTLTVAAGNQPGFGPGSTGHIALLNGTDQSGAELARKNLLASGTVSPDALQVSSFTDYSATFTTPSVVSGDLVILLQRDSGQQIDFDNVRLTVPEPASLGFAAIGGLGFLARRRRA